MRIPKQSRQRGRVVRSVVFTTATIARLMVQLPPKPRCCALDKMLHGNYLCLVKFNKQQIEEGKSKIQAENSEKGQLLSESEFVLCIAPRSLSRDRRIKMKKSSSSLFQKRTMNPFMRILCNGYYSFTGKYTVISVWIRGTLWSTFTNPLGFMNPRSRTPGLDLTSDGKKDNNNVRLNKILNPRIG